MKKFFSTLIKIILKCFTREHIFWQFIAVALTYIIVRTNLDWYYFTYTRSPILWYAFLPAIILGGILPVIIPIVLIAHGSLSKRENIINTGWLLAQAAIVGSFISSTSTLFIFIFGFLFTIFFPKIVHEDISKRTLLKKGIATVLITIGVFLTQI